MKQIQERPFNGGSENTMGHYAVNLGSYESLVPRFLGAGWSISEELCDPRAADVMQLLLSSTMLLPLNNPEASYEAQYEENRNIARKLARIQQVGGILLGLETLCGALENPRCIPQEWCTKGRITGKLFFLGTPLRNPDGVLCVPYLSHNPYSGDSQKVWSWGWVPHWIPCGSENAWVVTLPVLC